MSKLIYFHFKVTLNNDEPKEYRLTMSTKYLEQESMASLLSGIMSKVQSLVDAKKEPVKDLRFVCNFTVDGLHYGNDYDISFIDFDNDHQELQGAILDGYGEENLLKYISKNLIRLVSEESTVIV